MTTLDIVSNFAMIRKTIFCLMNLAGVISPTASGKVILVRANRSSRFQTQMQAAPVLSSPDPSLIFPVHWILEPSLFIFYLLRCTLPDFPSVSSMTSLPSLSSCHRNNMFEHGRCTINCIFRIFFLVLMKYFFILIVDMFRVESNKIMT